jgi:hypothetical protein
MTTKKLQEFFENQDFNVHLYEQDGVQCAEVEKWTDGGVDMIINLNPFTKEEFIGYVNDFNVDEEIESHRQDPAYKKAFTISEGLKDFNTFYTHLRNVCELLK